MAKIVISDLHPSDAKKFLHDLNSVQIDAILGSSTPELLLSTIFDGVLELVSNNTSPNTSGNKVFGVDFSNLAVNLIVI
ncbi:hypothetical protein [aff. Roholtiella sp. LEGE 12411]|uniref:hypothetical protein n=1 Tax=aff. Roholtiella sp. LEGE 12411 TaxID=1828822 RepID=UPI00187E250C|nr:hypothetical protein [aff. Roholtiella sp. LEGE 12411]MBE9034720.1 hypothetical protein [aff. Roholtiella sp. LEGE 12411]